MSEPRYRKVPGLGNESTYWFDLVDGVNPPEFIGTVRKTSADRWHTRPTWLATHKDGERKAYGDSRSKAVDSLLTKMKEGT